MKKTTLITFGLIAAALFTAACSNAPEKAEETEETTTEVTETTEETTAQTTQATAAPEAGVDPLFDEYLRFQPHPSPDEPEHPQTIEDMQDEVLIDLANEYKAEGYEFVATAEDLWYNGAGYAYIIDGELALLTRGFWVIGHEDDSQVNIFCAMASEELCAKYLGYVVVSEDDEMIEYSDPEIDGEETKIIYDKATGVLTFTNTIDHISEGVG